MGPAVFLKALIIMMTAAEVLVAGGSLTQQQLKQVHIHVPAAGVFPVGRRRQHRHRHRAVHRGVDAADGAQGLRPQGAPEMPQTSVSDGGSVSSL